jgi:predicted transcriptional regulator
MDQKMRGLGELEAVVMDRLWSWDRAATVREVFDQLSQEREIAYTTVMTVMDNLHRKGLLMREKAGRAWRYRAERSREEYAAQLMSAVLDQAGDREQALLRFVGQMTKNEVAALRDAIRRLS